MGGKPESAERSGGGPDPGDRLRNVFRGARVRKADVPGRSERSTGDARDVHVLEQPGRDVVVRRERSIAPALPVEAGDVGERVERSVGQSAAHPGDRAEALDHQVAAASERVAHREEVVARSVQRGDRGGLRHRRGVRGALALDDVDHLRERGGRDRPADAPAGHRVRLARSIDDHEPDYVVYPAYNEALGAAMQAETKMFFREFLMSDRSLSEMLTADFTFANQQLAEHYGLPPVQGDELQKVSLAGTNRKGILTQGSLLTVTSHPTRTSPVKRGKWVLTQLLCSKPPDPPAGVEGLKPEQMPSGTLRDLLEQHRQNPVCASCHDSMDPIGFGLESYDGVGAYRSMDTGGFPIDSSGELPTGEKFNSALELADIIATDPRYSRCVTRQVFTYALGRGVGVRDFSHLDHITQQFEGSGSKLKDLIQLIVTSEPFRGCDDPVSRPPRELVLPSTFSF